MTSQPERRVSICCCDGGIGCLTCPAHHFYDNTDADEFECPVVRFLTEP